MEASQLSHFVIFHTSIYPISLKFSIAIKAGYDNFNQLLYLIDFSKAKPQAVYFMTVRAFYSIQIMHLLTLRIIFHDSLPSVALGILQSSIHNRILCTLFVDLNHSSFSPTPKHLQQLASILPILQMPVPSQ